MRRQSEICIAPQFAKRTNENSPALLALGNQDLSGESPWSGRLNGLEAIEAKVSLVRFNGLRFIVACDTADKSVGYFHSSAAPTFEANRIANRRPDPNCEPQPA